MDMESITYDEAEFQRLYDQLLGYLGKDPELAEQIKALRIARGLTQNDLAERMGVPQSQVSRWENKGGCEIESLERLCKALAQIRVVKVKVWIWKNLEINTGVQQELSVYAEFELYSWAEGSAGREDGNRAESIRQYLELRFPFPAKKAHTKSGVKFLISVDGEAQSAQGILDRPEASVRWTLYELQHYLCRGERDSLLIRRYGWGNDINACMKNGWLSEMRLVRAEMSDIYQVRKWDCLKEGPYYPYAEGQTCMFIPLAWDNCQERESDFADCYAPVNTNLMIYTLSGYDCYLSKAGFGDGGFTLKCRRRIQLCSWDTAGKPLGFYMGTVGEPIAQKLYGKIYTRVVKEFAEEPAEEELWTEIQEGYFMAVYEEGSLTNEYFLVKGENRRYRKAKNRPEEEECKNESYEDMPMTMGKDPCDQKSEPLQEGERRQGRENELATDCAQKKKRERDELLDFRKIDQEPFAGHDRSIYHSSRWLRSYRDYHLKGYQELWIRKEGTAEEQNGEEKKTPPGGQGPVNEENASRGEILNYKEYCYQMSDWKLSENIPKVDYNNVYMTSYEQVNFDCRCGMWLNRGLALLRDMEDMRAYKHYVVYFKVENGRYCCIQYNGNRWKTGDYRGSNSCVALTFCSGADNKDGLPAPHTFKPLPADDPANYTYLFRLPEVKNHIFTGLPLKMGERSFMDFCLEVQKDCSFTNLRRLLPDTDETRPYVLIYRWQDGKVYLGGIEKGEFKGAKGRPSRGFEDIRSPRLWLKNFGDASDPQAAERVRGIFAYPAVIGVAVSAWENEAHYSERKTDETQGETQEKTEIPENAGETGAHGAAGLNGEGCPAGAEPPADSTAPLPGFISRREVSSRLFPPEEGMVEAASIVDTVHRLVVERGYMGECPPSDWKQKAGRLAGIVILGSPGVGKSTLAKRLVDTLVEFHVIPRSDTDPDDMCTAISARDLVGRYIGHTRPKTLKVIIQAIERKTVLFLDDVYTLFNTSGQDFGREALEALLPVLKGECRLPKIVTDEKSGQEVEQYETYRENQLPTILMAGYEKETRRFLNDNPGLYSQVTVLELESPSVPDLVRDLKFRIGRREPELLPGGRLEGENLRQAEHFYRRVTSQEYADQFAYFRGNETLAVRLATEYRFFRQQGEAPGWAQVWRTVTETYGKELIDNYEAILEANEERLGRARKQFKVEQDITETFNDVKGQETAVEKLGEVVDMLAHSDAYRLAGARLPKGALLVGPPGTGKTLLARAVAGETARRVREMDPGCSKGRTAFIALAATDLLAGGLGTGADRVRDLFLQAQKAEAASVVIFIDELDAVAKARGARGGADEVLIALLACMDGFSGNQNLFVLGATNRPEILDPALLRPGRFDRRIPVGLPDRKGREDILRLYAQKQLRPALAASLNQKEKELDARWAETAEAVIRETASRSYGASPAELANLVNEAGILAAGRGWRPGPVPADNCLYTVTLEDMLEALENMIVGLPSRKIPGAQDKKIVALHEIGHALLRVVDGEGNPVSRDKAVRPFEKVTCVPRGESALGYVINLPGEDKHLRTKDDLLAEVRCLLGGRAAEELTGGEGGVTQGAGDDLAKATGIVKRMVAQYGMFGLFGPAAIMAEAADYLGNANGGSVLPGMEQEVSREVIRVLKEQYEKTLQILTRWQGALETLAGELIRRETLSGEEFMEIWTRVLDII